MLSGALPVFVGLLALGAIIISVGMIIDSDDYWLIADYTTIGIFTASAVFLLALRRRGCR